MLLKLVARTAELPLFSDEVNLGLRCVAENPGNTRHPALRLLMWQWI